MTCTCEITSPANCPEHHDAAPIRPSRSDYVIGFAFGRADSTVLLIEKNRPDWQKGKLNGVGGKIEPGETPMEAMIREFEEEAGLRIENWRHFDTMIFEKARVFCFTTYATIGLCYQKTDEKLAMIEVRNLDQYPVIPNLKWLVPMALDPDKTLTQTQYKNGTDATAKD